MSEATAQQALGTLQVVMRKLGVKEMEAKICQPACIMIWLGILLDSEKDDNVCAAGQAVQRLQDPIARLELLNMVVAVKL